MFKAMLYHEAPDQGHFYIYKSSSLPIDDVLSIGASNIVLMCFVFIFGLWPHLGREMVICGRMVHAIDHHEVEGGPLC
jgi:hypothetical protein